MSITPNQAREAVGLPKRIRVGWLMDRPNYLGGAEMTQAEFRAAAPAGVEIVDCPPGEVIAGLDRYVVHNCVQYTPADMELLSGPVVKYNHDVGPWVDPKVRGWLDRCATHVCCSPVQARHMRLDAELVPPAVPLDRFRDAKDRSNGSRSGAVSVAQWRNPDKAPHLPAEWAAGNGGIDFYGGGSHAPAGSMAVRYDDMPALLASYKTFVFLPTALEPFCRLVAEAWAAGCEVVTNRLVGARYWLEEDPGAIETAGEDFWRLVMSA